MTEKFVDRVHSEILLDIGGDIGALIIYTREELKGKEIEVSLHGESRRVHTDVLERRIQGQPVFAAAFPALPEGTYHIWDYDPKPVSDVRIVGGEVSEVDWR